jgi:hypothetical protein
VSLLRRLFNEAPQVKFFLATNIFLGLNFKYLMKLLEFVANPWQFK